MPLPLLLDVPAGEGVPGKEDTPFPLPVLDLKCMSTKKSGKKRGVTSLEDDEDPREEAEVRLADMRHEYTTHIFVL